MDADVLAAPEPDEASAARSRGEAIVLEVGRAPLDPRDDARVFRGEVRHGDADARVELVGRDRALNGPEPAVALALVSLHHETKVIAARNAAVRVDFGADGTGAVAQRELRQQGHPTRVHGGA